MSAEGISDAFEKLLDSIASGVLVHRDFRPLYANRACARLLGFASAAEILALPMLLRLFPPDSRETVKNHHDALLAEGRAHPPGIIQIQTTAGGGIWAEVSQAVVDWHGEPAVSMTLVDAGKQMNTDFHGTK